jgi:hypothetical protein
LGDVFYSFSKRHELRPLIKESVSDKRRPDIDHKIDWAPVSGMIQVAKVFQAAKDGLNQCPVSEIIALFVTEHLEAHLLTVLGNNFYSSGF